ncbi:MAG: prepilin-type N-terminal cleavage/methylation domain-containing protein [Patescibacteria group bacterium]
MENTEHNEGVINLKPKGFGAKRARAKGFTLIEILIVIVIIAILALVVFIAINPAGRISDSQNTTSLKNVKAIINALETYTVDHNGTIPPSIPSLPSPLITTNTSSSGLGSGYNIENGKAGLPNCVQAGASSGTCAKVTSGSLLYTEIQSYLSSSPTGGPYYVGQGSNGNNIVVFAVGMKQGITTDTAGYGVAYMLYAFR